MAKKVNLQKTGDICNC